MIFDSCIRLGIDVHLLEIKKKFFNSCALLRTEVNVSKLYKISFLLHELS